MPRKHCRTRVRSRKKIVLTVDTRMVTYFAYAQTPGATWTEWRYRMVSQRQAQNLVAAGEAEQVSRLKDGVVQVVGYRALKPTSWTRPSPCTLTLSTMIAVSKRATQDKLDGRLTRAEQRQVEKFIAWPLIGDDRCPTSTVRPRISDADRRAAETMLQQGYLKAA